MALFETITVGKLTYDTLDPAISGDQTMTSLSVTGAFGANGVGAQTKSTLVADAKVDYTDDGSANDLDTDARRVAAMNATNTKLNAIIDVLVKFGFMSAT